MSSDPVFGPVLLFGEGGTAVEVVADSAVALPPLNVKLARELIGETRIWKRLKGYRDQPAVDLDALTTALLRISQLVVECPDVVELDVNPLLAGATGVVALDARMRVRRAERPGAERLAIRPYPDHLESRADHGGHQLVIRPIRPEDEPQHKAFLEALAPEDIRFRFFGQVREFAHTQLARFTQIDYDREMAFIATEETLEGPRTRGVVRAVSDPDREQAEFAIVVDSSLKGKGIGHALLEKMIDYCREYGIGEMVGEVLSENDAMLRLVERLGFTRARGEDPGVVRVALDLRLDAAQGTS
jgi:acetyltransferase